MLRLACGLVLGFASVARAAPLELAIGEAQLALEPVSDLTEDHGVNVRYAGFAQLTAGSFGADAAAGAALKTTGIGCSFVDVQAQGRARPGGAIGQLDYGFCLSRVALTLEFHGSRGQDLAPAIDARRSLWSRRYRARYDSFTLGGGELWGELLDARKDRHGARHTFLLFTAGHGVIEQHDAATVREIKQLDLDILIYRVRLTNRIGTLGIELGVFDISGIKDRADDLGGVTTTSVPVRLSLEGQVFGALSVGWGTKTGYLMGSGETRVNGEVTDSWSETIISTGLPNVDGLVGEATAGIKHPRFTASVSASRALFPTFDGDLAFEDRAAASVAFAIDRLELAISPFATRTRTFARETGRTEDHGAGASVRVGRELGKFLRLDAIGEAGITPYTRLDGARLSNTLGGQVALALSTRLAR